MGERSPAKNSVETSEARGERIVLGILGGYGIMGRTRCGISPQNTSMLCLVYQWQLLLHSLSLLPLSLLPQKINFL